jgi:hypothetical protein
VLFIRWFPLDSFYLLSHGCSGWGVRHPNGRQSVIEADPGVKGNTATNALKNAIVETGARVLVPLFIEAGDKIKVNTEDGSYLERVK